MTDDRQSAAALPAELATTMRQAGIDPRLAGHVLEVALHRAIAEGGGSCTWTAVDGGWVVTLHYPEEHRFFGRSLAEAQAWCLQRLQATARLAQREERNVSDARSTYWQLVEQLMRFGWYREGVDRERDPSGRTWCFREGHTTDARQTRKLWIVAHEETVAMGILLEELQRSDETRRGPLNAEDA